MARFFRTISYLCHPLLAPILGTVSYFLVTPKYSPYTLQAGNILPVFILTVAIPLIATPILYNTGVVKSFLRPSLRERRYLVLFYLALMQMVFIKVIPTHFVEELYYYFLGLILASLAGLLLLFLRFNPSFHMMASGSVAVFLLLLSLHFETNITLALSVVVLLAGLTASAQLFLRQHRSVEVGIGFFLGALSQILVLRFWL